MLKETAHAKLNFFNNRSEPAQGGIWTHTLLLARKQVCEPTMLSGCGGLGVTDLLLSLTYPLGHQECWFFSNVHSQVSNWLSALLSCRAYQDFKSCTTARPIQSYFLLSSELVNIIGLALKELTAF